MKWRVWSWHVGEPVEIQWENGKLQECPDVPHCEAWEQRMSRESAEDCQRSGWNCDEDAGFDGGLYVHPKGDADAAPPTRWREESELPKWFAENQGE